MNSFFDDQDEYECYKTKKEKRDDLEVLFNVFRDSIRNIDFCPFCFKQLMFIFSSSSSLSLDPFEMVSNILKTVIVAQIGAKKSEEEIHLTIRNTPICEYSIKSLGNTLNKKVGFEDLEIANSLMVKCDRCREYVPYEYRCDNCGFPLSKKDRSVYHDYDY